MTGKLTTRPYRYKKLFSSCPLFAVYPLEGDFFIRRRSLDRTFMGAHMATSSALSLALPAQELSLPLSGPSAVVFYKGPVDSGAYFRFFSELGRFSKKTPLLLFCEGVSVSGFFFQKANSPTAPAPIIFNIHFSLLLGLKRVLQGQTDFPKILPCQLSDSCSSPPAVLLDLKPKPQPWPVLPTVRVFALKST